MAFMFGSLFWFSKLIIESSLMLGVSEWALKEAHVQEMYSEYSWGNLKRHFPENVEKKSNAASNTTANDNLQYKTRIV